MIKLISLLLCLVACGQDTSIVKPILIPGPQGSPGLSIVTTTIPALLSQCPTGGNILILAQDSERLGIWSPKDLDQTSIVICSGIQGNPGTDGTSATSVSTVQFCSGYQTNYPGTFPEFGLVILGSIYAVYWDGHNAWLAQIVPGYYMSTSTSAPCNFIVNNDGTVSH